MNHKGKSQHDPNTVWVMDCCRREKTQRINDILQYSIKPHTREELETKNLARLREIYEKEVGIGA